MDDQHAEDGPAHSTADATAEATAEATADATAPGPLGDEAVRLISAVQDWAQRSFGATSPDGHTGSDCQWCPLCQFVAVLRGERPDVTERVAEAGTAVISALRALVDAATSPAAGTADAPPGPGTQTPRVQKINLDDD